MRHTSIDWKKKKTHMILHEPTNYGVNLSACKCSVKRVSTFEKVYACKNTERKRFAHYTSRQGRRSANFGTCF